VKDASKAESADPVATGTTQAGGEIKFDSIHYTQADIDKTYTYTISEVIPSEDDEKYDASIIYSTEKKTVSVKIEDGGSGTLKITPTYPDGSENKVVFTNTYTATDFTLTGKKIVANRSKPVQEGEFSFVVKDASKDESADPVATGTTLADGTIKFSSISYTRADIGNTYTYIISEVIPATDDEKYDANITYSTEKKKVTVTIGTDGSGNLTITPNYDPDGETSSSEGDQWNINVATNTLSWRMINQTVTLNAAGDDTALAEASEGSTRLYSEEGSTTASGVTFVNTYHASGSVKLSATKELTGDDRDKPIGAGEFNFVVKDASKAESEDPVATGTTKAGGEIDFTPISYDETDIGNTYTYTISEVIPSEDDEDYDPLITYTTATITVAVTVSDGGSGTISTTEKYSNAAGEELKLDKNEVKFVNEYHLPVPTGIRVDILSYVMMIAIAACQIMLLTIYKRKKRSVRRR
jgi:hypothetical protein